MFRSLRKADGFIDDDAHGFPPSGLAACLSMRARDLILIGTGAMESTRRLLRARPGTPLNPLHNEQKVA